MSLYLKKARQYTSFVLFGIAFFTFFDFVRADDYTSDQTQDMFSVTKDGKAETSGRKSLSSCLKKNTDGGATSGMGTQCAVQTDFYKIIKHTSQAETLSDD